MKAILQKKYDEQFHAESQLVVRSPGRINIIGEHTDYNDGFVLPAAIDKAVYIALGERTDNEIHLFAVDFNELFITTLHGLKPILQHWSTYILGVIHQFQQKGFGLKGFNAVILSDLPIGAGISSSAALECAVAMALNELFQCKLDKFTLIKMAQMAEHEFAGVQCGIMDMFASMMGKTDCCMKLDCRSLEYEYVPLELNDYSLILFNTNVKHSLASSAYNTRRTECSKAVAIVQEKYLHVQSLRDITIAMLNEMVMPFESLIYKRSKFVVEEIERLQMACIDLKNGNIAGLGKKMFATHDGLSNDYEVSCKELDYLVDNVRNHSAVLGARMMGGGFGGCTINIIHNDAVDAVVESVRVSYEREMKLPITFIKVKASNGTEIL